MAIPEKIGKYEISEQIGTGGFGAVYRGRDPFIKRTVAVKTCQLNDEEIKSRFFREAELAGNLHHRNITTIYDFGVENGIPYIVQEFLNGEDLDKVIKRGDPMPLSRKIEILIAITEGLHYAHENHIIHRDIKPANIRITQNGTIKIMDFGIAKSLQSESNLTQTGITLGTSAYLAPEQIRGEPLDRRTDVFSLGVLAYELLSYRKPFRGEHLSTVLYRILNEPPESLESINPEVPPALSAAVARAIEKNIDNRYPSMEALRQDLIQVYRQVVGGPSRMTTPTAFQPAGEGPTPFDPDETIKTPSKGMATATHITPPSGALARAPAHEHDETVSSASTHLPEPAGLELVNFRDPSQSASTRRTTDREIAPAPSRLPGRTIAIATGAVVLLAAAVGVYVFRGRSPEKAATAVPPPVATAPIVFPAPQVGQDAREPAAQPTARPAAAAPAPAVREETRKTEAARAPKRSSVQFSSIPVATLIVDGKTIGPSIPARSVELAEGKHTVRFEAAGLPPYEKQFTVGSGGAPPVAYKFPVGYLVINSQAWAGANVLIDSKFRGVLIGEKSFQLISGTHRVTLSREGVAPYTGEVTVSEGEKKNFTPPAPSPATESSS